MGSNMEKMVRRRGQMRRGNVRRLKRGLEFALNEILGILYCCNLPMGYLI